MKKSFLLIQGFCEPLSGLLQNYHPLHIERIKREIKQFGGSSETIKVQCRTLNDLFEENNMYHVDYLSIVTEGSELEILKAIDFEQFNINVISIEVNYDDAAAKDFLSSKGYTFVANITGDEIYKKSTE